MKKPKRYNDLISNFFYHLPKVIKYMNAENIHNSNDYFEISSNSKPFIHHDQYGVEKMPNSKCFRKFLNSIDQLKEIYSIIDLKYDPYTYHFENEGNSIFEDVDRLLVSRYIYPDWRSFIIEEISKNKLLNLPYIKTQVIASLKELEFRTQINYTWDLYEDIYCRWANNYILEGEILMCSPFKIVLISEDIEWVKNLRVEDVIYKIEDKKSNRKKIIINEKASKLVLINGLNKMIDENLLSKVKYSENEKIEHKKEIKNFINYITQKENEKPKNTDTLLNLSFITKPKELFKIFYYCSLNHNEDKDFRFIISKKTEIAKIFEGALHKSKNDGYSYSSLIRIVERDNPIKIERGSKPKRPENLLNHKIFNPIRSICRSEVLTKFIS